MGITNVFGKTFGILRNNPKILVPNLIFTVILGTAALYIVFSILGGVYGAGIYGSAAVQPRTHGAGTLSMILSFLHALLLPLVLLYVISLFIEPLLYGMYINIAHQGYGKSKVSLRTALRAAKASYGKLLGTEALTIAIWIIAAAILAAVFVLPIVVLGTGVFQLLWLGLGIFIAIFAAVLLGICLYEAYAVVMIERLGPAAAIKRSVSLGRQNTMSVFKIFLVTIAIVAVYSALIGTFQTLLELGFSAVGSLLIGMAIAQIINFVLSSGLSAWIAMIPAGFYFDYLRKGTTKPRRRR
jgi:hypothetical protein